MSKNFWNDSHLVSARPIWISIPFFILLLLTTNPAEADFILHSWQNHYEPPSHFALSLQGNYFTTSSNYDASGATAAPTGFKSLNRITTDLLANYGLFSNLSAFARLNWSTLNVTSSTRGGNGFGFGDQSVGLTYRAYSNNIYVHGTKTSGTFLDLQLQSDLPLYNNTQAEISQVPALGDGTYDFTGGIFGGVPIVSGKSQILFSALGIGYTFRTNSFSSAIPWNIRVSYLPLSSGLLASLTLNGLTSLKTDPSVSIGPRSSAATGGSMVTGGTNPSLLSLSEEIGYAFDPGTEMKFIANESLWGQATPNNFSFAVDLSIRFGEGKSSPPPQQTPQSYGKANSGLVRYSIEGRVLKSNDRMNLVKIDKGSQNGIEKEQLFDFFNPRPEGTANEPVARGVVISLKPDEAAIEVTDYFKEVWVDEGFIARRVIK